MIFILWIFGSLFIALLFGVNRTIGFWVSLLACLVLSPLIGLILTLFTETKAKVADRKKMMELQEQNNKLLQELNKTNINH